MKKSIRIISLLLALLTVMLVAASCADDEGDEVGDTTVSTEASDTAPKSAVGATGLELRDYGGRSMNIWYSKKTGWEPYPLNVTTAEGTGEDIINVAGYQRNQALEAQLNIVIDYTVSDTNPNSTGTDGDVAELRALWNAGDTDRFDIIMTGATPCGTLAKEGFYFDLNKSEYINPTAYYYESQVNEQLQYFGKQYFAAGYYSVMNTAAMDFTYVNYGMVEDISNGDVTLDVLYDKVLNKEWTYDYLMEIGMMYVPSNHTNTSDWTTSKYAYILSQRYTQALYYDFGGTTISYNDNTGEYECTLDSTSNQELLTWIQENIVSKRDITVGFVVDDKHNDAFIDEAAPFLTASLSALWDVLDSDLLWSLLPTPLKNEGDTYRAYSDAWNLNFAGIPANCRDTDKATYLYEMFMAYSYDYVYPAYYEKCFQVRYQPDEKSAQVFDLVAKSRVVCTANIYGLMNTKRLADMCRNTSFGVGATVSELSADIRTGLESFKPEE